MQTGENTPSIPIQALVESQERFLSFLEHRVHSRETARDILQNSYVT